MALSLAEARSMIDTARNHEVMLMIGQSQRYVPCYRKAYALIRGGLLGRIRQFSCSFGHSGPLDWSPRGEWFTDPELGGPGVVYDLGIHKADMVRFLTGQEVLRLAAFHSGPPSSESFDQTAAILELDSGATGTLLASWSTQGKVLDDFLLLGEKGSLSIGMEPGAPLVFYPVKGKKTVYEVPDGIPMENGAWLLDETAEFIECALGERSNPIPGEEGYKALEICIAIDRSARTREFAELPIGED
jgi:UDP-N-acetylglucosamine 3-dehydrogenase